MIAGLARKALLLLPALCGSPAFAQVPSVTRIEQLTENRGWNEAGIGPHYQMIVAARVSPSGFPTVVYAERDGERQALMHFPQPSTPDLYVLFQRVEAGSTGQWRIVAERGDARSAPTLTPGLASTWQVPLAKDVRITGRGAEPRVTWALPDFGGREIGRIRVAVRGEPRVHGRFMSALYSSEELPATAKSYAIPRGVLKQGERYIFQVALEDVAAGEVRNRSMAFSAPYTVR